MRSFFRSLETEAVRYLLISGQASILYGAATFSEDVDLWVAPAAINIDRFIRALHRSKAVAHKLTPALTVRHSRRGHGFHFRVPSPGMPEWYLDVMGQPPRVGGFSAAARRAVPSLREYLLVAQDRVHAELYTRQPDDSWLLREWNDPDEEIELVSVGCRLRIARMYSKVKFDDAA